MITMTWRWYCDDHQKRSQSGWVGSDMLDLLQYLAHQLACALAMAWMVAAVAAEAALLTAESASPPLVSMLLPTTVTTVADSPAFSVTIAASPSPPRGPIILPCEYLCGPMTCVAKPTVILLPARIPSVGAPVLAVTAEPLARSSRCMSDKEEQAQQLGKQAESAKTIQLYKAVLAVLLLKMFAPCVGAAASTWWHARAGGDIERDGC